MTKEQEVLVISEEHEVLMMMSAECIMFPPITGETMNFEQVAKDADATADYLEQYGWTRKSFGEHGGPRCIGGAYSSACSNVRCNLLLSLSFRNGYREMHEVFCAVTGETDIIHWNDHRCENKEQAVFVLREVADACRRVLARKAQPVAPPATVWRFTEEDDVVAVPAVAVPAPAREAELEEA